MIRFVDAMGKSPVAFGIGTTKKGNYMYTSLLKLKLQLMAFFVVTLTVETRATI